MHKALHLSQNGWGYSLHILPDLAPPRPQWSEPIAAQQLWFVSAQGALPLSFVARSSFTPISMLQKGRSAVSISALYLLPVLTSARIEVGQTVLYTMWLYRNRGSPCSCVQTDCSDVQFFLRATISPFLTAIAFLCVLRDFVGLASTYRRLGN
jgi:hypothetical protein